MIEQTTPRHFQCMQKTYYLKYSKTTYTCSFLIQQQSTWEMHSYCLYMWVTVVNEIDGPTNPHNAVKRKKKNSVTESCYFKSKRFVEPCFPATPLFSHRFCPAFRHLWLQMFLAQEKVSSPTRSYLLWWTQCFKEKSKQN